MRLRTVLLSQPDFAREPPFAIMSDPDVLDTPRDQRTPEEIAAFLKAQFHPAPAAGKRPKEIRRVTTCLTFEPSEDSVQTYPDWDACANLYVSVGIFTNNDGIRDSGFEGQPSSTARDLLVIITCGL